MGGNSLEMPETNMLWTDPNEVIDVFSDEEPGCTIGSQCKSFEAGKRNVVILFGGVGSHKGDLTDLMASEYNFHLICMEELVSCSPLCFSCSSSSTTTSTSCFLCKAFRP